jgi:hypothetical protein
VCPECRLKHSGLPNKADKREKRTPDPQKPPSENQQGENVTPNSYFFRTLLGDLVEEFSSLVSQSGLAAARRWYWRHTVKTIAHLAATAFRTAPWSTSAAVGGGFFLIGLASRTSSHAMQSFLDTHRIYDSHPTAYLFWLKFPLETGRVFICALTGVLVAFTVKGRDLIATTSLAAVQIALFFVAVIAVIATGRHWSEWFLFMLPWNCLCCLATIVGGAIVRAGRSVGTTRTSAT